MKKSSLGRSMIMDFNDPKSVPFTQFFGLKHFLSTKLMTFDRKTTQFDP